MPKNQILVSNKKPLISKPFLWVYLFLLWLILNLAANFYAPPHWSASVPLHASLWLMSVGIVLNFVDFMILIAFIGCLKQLSLRLGESRPGKLTSSAINLFIHIAVATYLAFLLISWAVYFKLQMFLNWSLLIAFKTHFIDVFKYSSQSLFSALLIIPISLALAYLFYKIVPPLKLNFVVVALLSLLVALFAAQHCIALALGRNEEQADFIRAHARYTADPRLAIGWGDLLLPQESYPTTQGLGPAASLDSWISKAKSQPIRHLNIILVVAEAFRGDILALLGGSERIAPNLNALSREGLIYRCFAQATESVYSDTAIATGLYPLTSPYRLTIDSLVPLPIHFYALLSYAGYRTATFISAGEDWQSSFSFLSSASFEKYYDSASEGTNSPFGPNQEDRTFGRAMEWISQVSASSTPFFVKIRTIETHFPFYQDTLHEHPWSPSNVSAAEGAELLFEHYPVQLKDKMRNCYYNTVWHLDRLVGNLVDKLKELKIDRQTVIIFTGDHGEAFFEHGEVNHGGPLYNEELLTPLLIWGPGLGLSQSGLQDQPVAHIDIAPTVLDLLGLPEYPQFQGRSVLGAEGSGGIPIFSVVQSFSHQAAVVLWPWKLIHNYLDAKSELFRLDEDPNELSSLNAAEEEIGRKLEMMLKTFRASQLSYYQAPLQFRKEYRVPHYQIGQDLLLVVH